MSVCPSSSTALITLTSHVMTWSVVSTVFRALLFTILTMPSIIAFCLLISNYMSYRLMQLAYYGDLTSAFEHYIMWFIKRLLQVGNKFTCVTCYSRPSWFAPRRTNSILYMARLVSTVVRTWFVAVTTVNVGSDTTFNDKIQWNKVPVRNEE